VLKTAWLSGWHNSISVSNATVAAISARYAIAKNALWKIKT